MRSISSSDGFSIILPTEKDQQFYDKEYELFMVRQYARIRALYGVWASNQHKFVSSPSQLNNYDSRFMEDLLHSKYKHLLIIGSCTCLTKTPEVEAHDPWCEYRILMEDQKNV